MPILRYGCNGSAVEFSQFILSGLPATSYEIVMANESAAATQCLKIVEKVPSNRSGTDYRNVHDRVSSRGFGPLKCAEDELQQSPS